MKTSTDSALRQAVRTAMFFRAMSRTALDQVRKTTKDWVDEAVVVVPPTLRTGYVAETNAVLFVFNQPVINFELGIHAVGGLIEELTNHYRQMQRHHGGLVSASGKPL